MLRARRLASVVSVALVGVLALGACGREAPDAAAYVGDFKITDEQVTRIVDEARQKLVQPSASPQGPQSAPVTAPSRKQVVSTLVLGEVCRRLATDKDYRPQGQVTPDQVSAQIGVASDATYTRKLAELHSCLSVVPTQAPAAPTQQELADVLAAGKAGGLIPADVSVADAAQQLDGPQLRGALAAKKTLAAAVADYDLTVNPRYRPLAFPVLSFRSDAPAVSIPLGESDDAVTDLPSAATQETPGL